MKELTVKINLTDDDTREDIFSLFMEIMEVCGDNFYSIESATVDGKEMFCVGKGFCGEFGKKGE